MINLLTTHPLKRLIIIKLKLMTRQKQLYTDNHNIKSQNNAPLLDYILSSFVSFIYP